MASFEKMAKLLIEETTKTATFVEKLTQSASVLRAVLANQEIMISQNKQIIELLQQASTTLPEKQKEDEEV